jgi:glutamyl/glutaminyl-tRNA synthetase
LFNIYLFKTKQVVRGEEWLSSTAKHALLYAAFAWPEPTWTHLPLLLNAKQQKLSKRHDDVSVEHFIAQNYLPEALVNFVAFLGWNPGAFNHTFSLLSSANHYLPCLSIGSITLAFVFC